MSNVDRNVGVTMIRPADEEEKVQEIVAKTREGSTYVNISRNANN